MRPIRWLLVSVIALAALALPPLARAAAPAPPDTMITSGPTGLIHETTPSFTFIATEVGARFECRLDTPAGPGTYSACTSPQRYTTTADGAYTFSVRALSGGPVFGPSLPPTDPTPATQRFTVAAPPDTIITSGPSGEIDGTTPSFTFTASEPGARFECRLDTPAGPGSYSACTSPQRYTTTAGGAYTFSVRALSGGPVFGPSLPPTDPTPATRSFSVAVPAPATIVRPAGAVPPVVTSTPTPGVEPTPVPEEPVAGVRVRADVTGQVSATLPDGAVIAVRAGASLPVGSVVDARKGVVALTSATGVGRGRASARVRAGIFKIRQQRARARTPAVTDLQLVTTAQDRARCRRVAPGKGLVRSLTVVTKGLVRVTAGAATITSTGPTASWTTTDRCDGTLVRALRGRVRVQATKGTGRKTTVVNATDRLLIKARIFTIGRSR